MPTFSLKQSLLALPEDERQIADTRILELQAGLAQDHQLDIRDDSYLAYLYSIAPMVNPSLKAAVVREIADTQNLYSNTELRNLQQTKLAQVANLLHEVYPDVPWKVLWKKIRIHICPLLKLRVLGEET